MRHQARPRVLHPGASSAPSTGKSGFDRLVKSGNRAPAGGRCRRGIPCKSRGRAKSANKHISNPISSVIRSAELVDSNRFDCMVIWLVMTLIEENSGNWRVGVLFSQTGVTSAIEQTQLNATLLAIEEINSSGGVLDRMVEPVIYDPASDPKQFRSLAERLFQIDRVRLLFPCYMSSTRKAVVPVVE